MIIFHGGYIAVETPKIILSKFAKDFGSGFYCTELEEQAIRWAKRYDTPIVSKYDYFPDNSLKICKRPTHQICFCSERALKCITFKKIS
jgi:hypothetical protein